MSSDTLKTLNNSLKKKNFLKISKKDDTLLNFGVNVASTYLVFTINFPNFIGSDSFEIR